MTDVKMMNVMDVFPYDKNPRKNDDAVQYVANSIKEFGFKVPIVVDKNMVVVTGHTRLKAAKSLGITEIPVIVADDLTDEQIKAYRIADNKAADKAYWDEFLLMEELEDIGDAFDMKDFGFEEWELNTSDTDEFIESLEKDGLEREVAEADTFGCTFQFPKEKKEIIEAYLKLKTKQEVVNMIIHKAEEEYA